MSVSVRFEMDHDAVRRMLSAPDGLVGREVHRVTERVADRARSLAPVDSGDLRDSIETAYRNTPGETTGIIYSALDYSVWIQRGTGVYGPTNRPITPKHASVLVFKIGGRKVFARSVRGTPPDPFMLEALRAVSPWPVTALG